MRNIDRLTWLVLYIVLISILYAIYTLPTPAQEPEYCIADKWRDGLTATGTPIREGVVAINVDWIDGKWQVRSPLELGDKIYIEGIGFFSVEDTGPFTEENFHFDMWNLDIYKEDLVQAKEWGVKKVKVFVVK